MMFSRKARTLQVAVTTAGIVLGSWMIGSQADAAAITEVEPNDAFGTAQNVDGFFTLDADANIANATTIPHVSITGTGNDTYDYYAFTVGTANSVVVLDIDTAGLANPVDSHLRLLDAGGAEESNDNDTDYTLGAGGSLDNGSSPGTSIDAYISYLITSPGLYIVEVGQRNPVAGPFYTPIPAGTDYVLHISVENARVTDVPEPATASLLGLGLLGLAALRRRKRQP